MGFMPFLGDDSTDYGLSIFHVQGPTNAISLSPSQVWNKPDGARMVAIYAWGAGGSGGAGFTRASGAGGGGGGGGGGNIQRGIWPAFALPDRLFVRVGRGGIGPASGNGQTGGASLVALSNNTSPNLGLVIGNAGTGGTGGNVGGAGAGGSGGTTTAVTGNPLASLGSVNDSAGGAATAGGGIGGTGVAGVDSTALMSTAGGAGGSGGGGTNGADFKGGDCAGNGGDVLTDGWGQPLVHGGAAGSHDGESASWVCSPSGLWIAGGAGGGSSNVGVGGAGGRGGVASGGGGGGAGTTGGKAGDGGDGVVIIIWF